MFKAAMRGSIAVAIAAAALAAAQPAPGAPNPRSAAFARLAADSIAPVRTKATGGSARHFVVARVPLGAFSTAAAPAERGRAFWDEYGAAFGIREASSELVLRSVRTDALGMTHLRYAQRYRGLEVFGRVLMLHLDGNAARVVNGEFSPRITVETTPKITRASAAWVATMAVPVRGRRDATGQPTLLVYVDRNYRAHLAWRADVWSRDRLGFWRVFVDALTGDVLDSYDDLQTARNRMTFDSQNFESFFGPLKLNESGCVSSPCDAVLTATHANTAVAYDYFASAHGRDSFNNAGATINSHAHYGSAYNNAFYCSSCGGLVVDRLAYGDGDGVVFSPLGADQDIVVHEFGHAVTRYTANLTYLDQSGALNEAFSDVWAAMADNDGAEWLVGESSFTPGIPGDALRNMADPPQSGDPGHWSQYLHTLYDSGGVHINSGIANRAAFLMAADPAYGIGRTATRAIHYRALTTYLTPSSDFRAQFNAMLQAAADLFGPGSAQERAVRRAYGAVGLTNPPLVTSPNGGGFIQGGAPGTITWNDGDTGAPVAIEILQDNGVTNYTEPFATGPALPSGFATGGHAGWFVDPAAQIARSGTIGHSQRSELFFTIRMVAPGSITFRASLNSELNFDFFSFYVDGQLRLYGSGFFPMSPVPAVAVPAGLHTLAFVYETDSTVAPPNHGAAIDDLVIPNAENIGAAALITGSAAPGATSQPWFAPLFNGSNFRIRVRFAGAQAPGAADYSDGTFGIDSSAPADPGITSPSHRLGVTSADRTVDVSWSGASDSLSGVDGYSYEWSTGPTTLPDAVKDAEESASRATSPALPNGRHWLHLRTRDNVGNWTATVHLGPFVIGTVRRPRQLRCVVPNLRGRTVAQARRLLASRRCRLGTVRRVSSRARRGRIVGQSRRAGARLPLRTRVNVRVSRGRR